MRHWFNKDKTSRVYNSDYSTIVEGLVRLEFNIKMIVTDPPYLHEKGGGGKCCLGILSIEKNST